VKQHGVIRTGFVRRRKQTHHRYCGFNCH